jgi:hypothetical protein
MCKNRVGSFSCHCNPGFHGDGFRCSQAASAPSMTHHDKAGTRRRRRKHKKKHAHQVQPSQPGDSSGGDGDGAGTAQGRGAADGRDTAGSVRTTNEGTHSLHQQASFFSSAIIVGGAVLLLMVTALPCVYGRSRRGADQVRECPRGASLEMAGRG